MTNKTTRQKILAYLRDAYDSNPSLPKSTDEVSTALGISPIEAKRELIYLHQKELVDSFVDQNNNWSQKINSDGIDEIEKLESELYDTNQSLDIEVSRDNFKGIMKVFISHKFEKENQKLALSLSSILRKQNIEGYLAESKREYDLLIGEKIRKEIKSSDYVIGIITKQSEKSASVNQELGYAMGCGIPIVIMVEKGITHGVLTHGRETEEFTREKFTRHCRNISEYILQKGKSKPEQKQVSFESFLKDRNLTDYASEKFGHNKNSTGLENPLKYLATSKKPFVLFTSYPKYLLENIPIKSEELTNWLEQYRTITIPNFNTVFLKGFEKFDLDSITYHYPDPREYTRYLELNENGLVEQGFTKPLIYHSMGNPSVTPFLHLCWLTGAFWAFLTFCTKYYTHIGFRNEFEVRLSVRDIKDLMLMGFGGGLKNGNKWADPADHSNWDSSKPKTDHTNLSLIKHDLNIENLSEKRIAEITREFSDKISNAYDLKTSMCYNHDGTLNYELFSFYNRK